MKLRSAFFQRLQKIQKTLWWHFSLVTSVEVFGELQAVPEIRSEENDRDCKRQTFKSQGRHVCIVKQNNPNNPSHTEARGNKGKNPASSVTPEIGLLFKQRQSLINNLEQFHQTFG